MKKELINNYFGMVEFHKKEKIYLSEIIITTRKVYYDNYLNTMIHFKEYKIKLIKIPFVFLPLSLFGIYIFKK